MQNIASKPFPNSAELTSPVVSRRRSNFLPVGLLFPFLALATQAMAALQGDPFFLTLGQTPIPANSSVTFNYSLRFFNTAGVEVDFASSSFVNNPSGVPATFDDTALANSIANSLNQDPRINAEYTFRVERTIFGYMQVLGIPNAGHTPTVIRNGVTVRGAPDMIMSTGTWLANADAIFEILGTPSASSSDEVFLGVNGYVVDTPTAMGGVPKSLTQIRLDLLQQLLALGFTNAFIDPVTGLLDVPADTDGDPPAGDWGGVVFSTDPGLILTTQMTNTNAAMPRPPRGTVNAPATAMSGATITVSISRFPANSTIDITVNGQAAGTITTNASGSGSTMVTLPNGPKGVPLEIRAAGGTPITFGYAWITLK